MGTEPSARRLHDSSKTRVVPVFDALLHDDPTGSGWLGPLLRLPERGGAPPPVDIPPVGELIAWGWGSNEISLPAPLGLLRHLVESFASAHPEPLPESTPARRPRELLRAGQKDELAEALAALDAGPPESGWYIFEGPSKPDVCLQTNEVIVVVEGKRTERGPTRHTDWMSCRDQMLRHIDAAWDIADGRQVLGFYVVEGGTGSDATKVPDEWARVAVETTSPAVLDGSLPHRSASQRQAIARAFLGVTSWQAVCATLGLPWSALPDQTGPEVPAVPLDDVPLRVLGVDGFGGKWLGVLAEAASDDKLRFLSAEVFADFAAVLRFADLQQVVVVAVDIPIGLPEEAESPAGVRAADQAAQAVLGSRRSSLFPMPPATILSQPWAAANEASKKHFGRGISKQSYSLGPKISDVARQVGPGRSVVEVHPEVSFTGLLGTPAAFPKKTVNGQAERRRVLTERAGLELPSTLPGPAGLAKVDDLLDAGAAAWTALRVAKGTARTYPEAPPIRNGREIAIWA